MLRKANGEAIRVRNELVWMSSWQPCSVLGALIRSRNLSARSLPAVQPSVERSHGGSAVLADHEGQSRGRVSRLQVPGEEERGYHSVLAVPGAGLSRSVEDELSGCHAWRPAHASTLLRQVHATTLPVLRHAAG
jgi:hypothetical protein